MTGVHMIGILAGGALIGAIVCRAPIRSRVWALISNLQFIGYAVAIDWTPLLIPGVVLLPLTIWRLLRGFRTRRPNRQSWQMDRDVHDRVSDIRAYSRYDSAGIEF